ncbi:helix-turn-helix domain-containing protein [Corallococcus sp. M34]|uniref:AraC family transcriptional regulator n=1 Tax=Citreicoccus inhibens TaxID=2849499 RepID=UPI001C22FD3F|nr:helix-turn-helix domain-containing protein [Citreicoccus inhibens]MBU8900096.1 helix-turn-helix domain-containing protein [Citreicoccus inhibens]
MSPASLYFERRPCAALAPYVQCFWALSAQLASPPDNRVLPDGCLDILVNLSPGQRAADARPQVIGTMLSAEVVPLEPAACFVGVRFRPGGARPFLRVPLDEVTGSQLCLDNLWPSALTDGWTERLLEAPGDEARMARMEELLLRRLPSMQPDAALSHAVERIRASRGRVTVESLEATLGVGARQLERRFQTAVGLAPKVLCRIARMQHAVEWLKRTPTLPGAQLALAAGYFDQAHLVREFKALVGASPGAYARELASVGFVQFPSEEAL